MHKSQLVRPWHHATFRFFKKCVSSLDQWGAVVNGLGEKQTSNATHIQFLSSPVYSNQISSCRTSAQIQRNLFPLPPPFFLLALFFGVEHSQSHTHTGKSFLDNYSLPVTLLEYRLAWRTHKTHSLLPGRMSRQMHHHHHHHHYYLSISSAPTYRKPGKDKSLRKENTTRQKWLPTLVS